MVPPKKMASMLFLRAVINGRKRLLKVRSAVAIPKIPKYGEIDVRKLWNEIKSDAVFSEYFPDTYLQGNYVPDRTYFSQSGKRIFASIYSAQFYSMLERISDRRITRTAEDEKITADTRIFNELTAMKRFCHDSNITRSDQ